MVVSPFFHKYNMDTNNKIEFIKTTTSNLESGKVQAECPETYLYSFIHTHDVNENGTADEQLYIGEERITDRFNVGNTGLSISTIQVGNLKESTIGELSSKSVSQIILDMVLPERKEPQTLEDPSISISYPGETLIKVGDRLPELEEIQVNISNGVWSDGETPVAGGHSDCSLNMAYVHSCSHNVDWGSEAEYSGTYAVSGNVMFYEGNAIPKDTWGYNHDEEGNEYPHYIPEDSDPYTYAEPINITAVNPVYINGYKTREGDDYDPITYNREYLINYFEDSSIEITIPAETFSERMVIYVDGLFSKFDVYKYDPTRSDISSPNPSDWTVFYNPKPVAMKFVYIGNNEQDKPYVYKYVRDPEVDNSYNTAPTLYKINLKK